MSETEGSARTAAAASRNMEAYRLKHERLFKHFNHLELQKLEVLNKLMSIEEQTNKLQRKRMFYIQKLRECGINFRDFKTVPCFEERKKSETKP